MSDPSEQFNHRSLAGARFADVDLSFATFDDVSLRGTCFADVTLADAVFRDVSLRDVTIDDCDLVGMKIDGVLVTDLLSAWRERPGQDRVSPMMSRLIPKIFYADVDDGVDLFVDVLGFEVRHRDETLVVVERDGAKAYLEQDAESAAKDRPEIAIETDTIDALHAEIAAKRPERLHPNLKTVRTRPWGAREFAVLDRTGVCVVFRQW